MVGVTNRFLLETLRRLKLLTGLRSVNPPLAVSVLAAVDESSLPLAESFESIETGNVNNNF